MGRSSARADRTAGCRRSGSRRATSSRSSIITGAQKVRRCGGGLLGRQTRVGHADRDLVGHPDDAVEPFGVRAHPRAPARESGLTSTAVTLYSGQFVAQSELSVVTTFAPLTGWWKVV